MTVCIAAIYDNSSVVGASDRMLTAGDIQFQPYQSKIWALTTSVVAMVAGDIAVQAEVFQYVSGVVTERVKTEPENWWKVSDVAELYSRAYVDLRLKRAERASLAPLGLDRNSFIQRQKELTPEVAQRLLRELTSFELPGIATIIAGVDGAGPHLYVIENHLVSCNDATGFAAIGAGNWHANSLFMSAGHTRSSPGPRTLLITHRAKRKAEVAPGVGAETDMFVIGPALGSYVLVRSNILKDLDRFHSTYTRKIHNLDRQSERKLNDYVRRMVEQKPPVQQVDKESKAES